MEESNEEHRVVPELYFLIAKFLSGGPLKETAKTLLKELETVEVLPRRLDWEGTEHTQTYDELADQYAHVSWHRLATVCERALQLARRGAATGDEQQQGVAARLSLLSESLVRPPPQYASHRQDDALVRRLTARELGVGAAAMPAGPGGQAVFSPKMLGSLTLQRRTLGHLSAVYCVVFDCTGRYVITGADDMLVKIWSAVDGRLVATLRGVRAEVTDVCASADGALVACGSVDRLVRVWCLRSAEPRAVLAAHQGTITSVHWAPPARRDVRWLASTSTDCSVAFWTCSADGHFLSQPVQYVERMRPGVCHMICAAWSAGGAFLAAGSADHHVRVYTVEHEPGGPKRVLETAVHDDAVDSISWAHRGLRFVSGSKDGTAALWTLHATQWRHALLRPAPTNTTDGKKLKMTMVCWDSSDAYVLTAVSDNTIRVWCSRTCTQVRSLVGHRDEAYVLEAHPWLSGVFLSAGHDGQLFVWDCSARDPLASFHNALDGHGDGAIFDAKWGGAATVAATDSHGHLLLLGLGRGHRLFSQLPTELFFHTDYRPLIVDAAGGAHDEQTDTPPHLLPPPFLVDVEGAPHAPEYQRLVPGRENLTLSQLIPAADAPRSQINSLMEALAASIGAAPARGPWRGEGVRYTAGSWQRGEPLLAVPGARALVAPPAPATLEQLHRACAELNALEQAWYRREMRRRPLMISTAPEGSGGRRRAGRKPGVRAAPPRPAARPTRPEPPEPESASCSDTSDEWVQRPPSTNDSRAATASSMQLDDTTSTSSSSQYSDWEAGAALAPPARARRRPLRPTKRYSPSHVTTKRAERAPPPPADPAQVEGEPPPPDTDQSVPVGRGEELPDEYRPGEWITAVSPRKAPYHPQMGDECLYFRLGHQRYFEAVAEKDVYKITARDRPWERQHVYECELVKVVGIKYAVRPPRVVCLRLASALGVSRALDVRYHDMPDVIDFMVLRQQYEAAVARRWGAGDRFRCMIDDCWWTGEVLERTGDPGAGAASQAEGADGEAARAWSSAAAAHFLALKVRWDNGEVERLSPWDLEPLDSRRLPAHPGGAVAVLPRELDAVLYRAGDHEWGGRRADACRAIATHIGTVMTLSAAEPFVAPVDLQQYPAYARVVPYPVDLATIRSRCEHLFYRRAAAVQFDARYIATNAEKFNEPHAPIVRQARLVTDLLLHVVSEWRDCDVLAKYRELQLDYRSDDERAPRANNSTSRRGAHAVGGTSGGGDWRVRCERILTELMASADSEPFRRAVSPTQAPDYQLVVSRPMDLGAVRSRLLGGEYRARDQFAADVRQVFANSRLYNTNKRSRIYSMTVRLSALFEALWVRHNSRTATRAPRRAARQRHRGAMNGVSSRVGPATSDTSDSETLAATSRRVHAAQRHAPTNGAGPAHNAAGHAPGTRDSWDSDAPLRMHSKGKGIGKKSKSSGTSVEPRADASPGPSRAPHEPCPPLNGRASSSSSREWSACSDNALHDGAGRTHEGAELAYTDSDRRYMPHSTSRGVRKRRLASDSSASGAPRPTHRRRPKRTRERFTEGSSSSSSSTSEGGESARRYESDRSYRPRYSTDDDRPLNLYRDNIDTHRLHSHSRGVSLRARRSQRRYNEDSEEDSAAAISKRSQHHARDLQQRLATRRRHAPTDHDYFNGRVPLHDTLSAHHQHVLAGRSNGEAEPSSSNNESSRTPPAAVSISSRGRVRKLTPKARGLLHD